MEYMYVDDQLVFFIDRDPKYKLDLNAIKPEIAADNPYVKLFLDEGIVRAREVAPIEWFEEPLDLQDKEFLTITDEGLIK